MAHTKVFNGKRYYFHTQYGDMGGGKDRAKYKAERIKKSGGHTKITTEGKGSNKIWIIWTQEKKYEK